MRLHTYSYSKSFVAKNVPQKRRSVSLVPAVRFVKDVDESTNCSACAWPLKTSGVVCIGSVEGNKQFKHVRCPSSRERSVMRQTMLMGT